MIYFNLFLIGVIGVLLWKINSIKSNLNQKYIDVYYEKSQLHILYRKQLSTFVKLFKAVVPLVNDVETKKQIQSVIMSVQNDEERSEESLNRSKEYVQKYEEFVGETK